MAKDVQGWAKALEVSEKSYVGAGERLALAEDRWLQSFFIVDTCHVPALEEPLVSNNNKTWMCLICGWIYDEAAGDPDHGIAPGTAWADVPMNWTCPECGARKEDFEMVEI